jgi:hypothetical protein
MSIAQNGGRLMTDLTPVETTNLDQFGNEPLPWSRPHDLLAAIPPPSATFFLGTRRPNGTPHATPFGALWFDGDIYLVSGPDTRKSRNLAANPACTVSVALEGIDLVLEGEAARVTDEPTLAKLAALYRESGWPVEVKGDAYTAPYTAPSGGPPPWFLYRIAFDTAFGVATQEPHGATRWRFDR